MTKPENKQILDTLHETATTQYQEIVPQADGSNGEEIYNTIRNYPTVMNEFISTLTNKLASSMFFSKVFNNPLKMLHKGTIPYGTTIEQLFVEMAEMKGFDENFSNSTSDEGNLIKALPPKVAVKYITENFQRKIKASFSDQQLKKAFMSQTGLADLLTQITNSVYNQANVQEYNDIKGILTRQEDETTADSKKSKGIIKRISESGNVDQILYVDEKNPHLVAQKIRATVGKLSFVSPKYNLAKMETFSAPDELIFFTTPDTQANIDVNVLAQAFNVSSADMTCRIILVDDLGTITKGEKTTNVIGVLADKDAIQQWDTVLQSDTFRNGERMTTNLFHHHHGISATCDFANTIVFADTTALS